MQSALLAAESLKKKFTSMANESPLKSNFVIPDPNPLRIKWSGQVPMYITELFKCFKLSDDQKSSSNLWLEPPIPVCSMMRKSKFAF